MSRSSDYKPVIKEIHLFQSWKDQSFTYFHWGWEKAKDNLDVQKNIMNLHCLFLQAAS